MPTSTSSANFDRAVVLFSHGSRDPLWRAPIEAVQRELQQQQPDTPVRCAYLELCDPPLQEVVRSLHSCGARRLTIVPMFLGTGRHAREDLPALVTQLRAAHPDLDIHVREAIGEDARMTSLMAKIAGEETTSA